MSMDSFRIYDWKRNQQQLRDRIKVDDEETAAAVRRWAESVR